MTLITLTTDFGIKDASVAMVKGALYSEVPGATVVDISHQISPYNLTQAAYILKNAFTFFPKGTIHIIGVDAAFTPENIHLALTFDGQYFIGADNGIFSLVFGNKKPDKIVAINIHQNLNSTFPLTGVFTKVAGHLARKGTLDVIGKTIGTFKELTDIRPVVNPSKNEILGSIIYIDNYGNVITNVTEKFFNEIGKSRPFTIYARSVKFNKVYDTYSEIVDFNIPASKRKDDGKKLALFNTAGHLEFAIYRSNPETLGGANTLFGLDYRDSITIKFD